MSWVVQMPECEMLKHVMSNTQTLSGVRIHTKVVMVSDSFRPRLEHRITINVKITLMK